MISLNIPSGIRKLSDRNKDLCSGRLAKFKNICALFTMYLYSEKSLSELVRDCPWTHSVSDLSRAIKEFKGDRFMRRLRSRILKHYKDIPLNPEDFCYAIDDTDNPKYGKTTFRNGLWHGSKGVYKGQKVLVIVLVDMKRGFAIPLNYAFVAKKDDPDYKPGWELGLDLFEELLEKGFPPLCVTADSWFDCTQFIIGIENRGFTFAGEIKSNRLVKTNPGPYVKWRKLNQQFQDNPREKLSTRFDNNKRNKKVKYGATKVCMIKNFNKPLKIIAVYNAKNSTESFAYYVSTNLSLTGARLWELSRARWKIECLFRDLKQFLSFGKLPAGGKEAADLAVCFPFMVYTSLRLDPLEYWKLEKRESIGMMCKRIQEREFEVSIAIMIGMPNNPKIEKIRARRQRIHRKPVDKPAGNTQGSVTLAA